MSEQQSPWLTAKEAAAFAKCSPKTITREARSGKLTSYRLAKRRSYRFLADDVTKWLKASAMPTLVTTSRAS